jgi:hypothetical protein
VESLDKRNLQCRTKATQTARDLGSRYDDTQDLLLAPVNGRRVLRPISEAGDEGHAAAICQIAGLDDPSPIRLPSLRFAKGHDPCVSM